MRQDVPKALKNYFLEKGITTKEIAEKVGVSTVHVSALLSGRTNFGTRSTVAWNEAFGFNIKWLLTGNGSMFEKNAVNEETPQGVDELQARLNEQQAQLNEMAKKYDRLLGNFLALCEKTGVTMPLDA